jgi:hypothetical protein
VRISCAQHLIAAFALMACAPTVDGPAERQRVRDREDGERLRAQVAALPGVDRAEVVLVRSEPDPLAPRRAVAGHVVSVVVIVDDKADRAAVAGAAGRLAQVLVPAATPTVFVEVGAPRPELARVGPFEVAASSKRPLQATLVAVFVLLVGFAGTVILRERRRRA